MPTPEFVLRLREKVGHELLLLPGVNAVVFDAAGDIMLTLRADTREWHLVAGIVEPEEHPETTIAREALEEAGVTLVDLELLQVSHTPEVVYPNGDRCTFVTTTYTATLGAGAPFAADDENLEVRCFAPTALPQPLSQRAAAAIELALARREAARV